MSGSTDSTRRRRRFTDNGQTQTLPETKSYEIVGSLNHALTRNIRARARLDYFTDLVTQQLYHQNLYQASRNRRVIEAGVSAAFGSLSTNLLYQRNEIFSSATSSQVYGSTPRVTTTLSPQRLFNAPIYASANVEYAFLPDRTISDGIVVTDTGYTRLDATPTVRVPLSRLTFLSVNTSAAYRTTHYSRSSSVTSQGATIDEPYLRQYMTLRSEVVGPVFTRIWDLQGGAAERLKHVIEPAFTVDFTSRIADYNRTPVVNDYADFVVSGTTRYTYGLTNRVFTRGRTVDNVRGTTREIMTVGLQQTYYSNAQSGGFDSAYQSTYGTRRPVDLSPIALTTRVSPFAAIDTNMRLEYDVSEGAWPADALDRRQCQRGCHVCRGQLQPQSSRSDQPQQLHPGDERAAMAGRPRDGYLQRRLGHRPLVHRQPERDDVVSGSVLRSDGRIPEVQLCSDRDKHRGAIRYTLQFRVHPRRAGHILELLRRPWRPAVERREGTDSQRRQGHAAQAADLYQRQAARADRQQARVVLRDRGHRQRRHS
jgi:hypothetical protein